MKSFIKVMKAISDPNRVKIVKMLQQKMMCVCELQGDAANLLGNIKHWLEDDPEIVELFKKVPLLDREELCKK
jgi:ArsR family transcriptional regulator